MFERHYACELGIYHYVLRDGEEAPRGDTIFEYDWLHVPTGRRGTGRVALLVDNRSQFLRLLEHWSRFDAWKYGGR